MPTIRPISDLRNNANDISEFCHTRREPVFITKNGVGDLVVMSVELFEKKQTELDLYRKLATAESEIDSGAAGEDFFQFAKKLRAKVHGKI
jgi:prevent-host-death family protein